MQDLAGKSTIVCISDGSLLPILIGKAGIPSVKQVRGTVVGSLNWLEPFCSTVQVFTVERTPHCSRVMAEV